MKMLLTGLAAAQWIADIPHSTVAGIFGVILVLIIVAALILSAREKRTCAKCGKAWALEKTGNVEEGSLLKWDKVEWKCKYCGHTIRRSAQSPGFGAGGG